MTHAMTHAMTAAVPGQTARLRVHPLPPPRRLPTGFDAFVHRLLGLLRRRPGPLRALQLQVAALEADIDRLASLSDAALQAHLQPLREDFRRGRDAALAPGLAAVAEAARRSLGMRPYPVQLVGALALHRGLLAEMATGEGKTLTAGLAAVLAAWNGKPCHVLTANDYLAARDAATMQPLYALCGLEVAAVGGDMSPPQRRSSYAADIVYVTAKELLGDFLRDRLTARRGLGQQRLQLQRWLGGDSAADETLLQVRGLHSAIVDEADSLLIDEAVTPLILSAPRADNGTREAVQIASAVATTLQEKTDYQILPRQRTVRLLPSACDRMAGQADRLPSLWRARARREELLRQALCARLFFHPGQHYVIQDGKIVLLDEYTGRMTPNRTLTAGLHQAIEASAGLEISDTSETLTQRSFQAFFRQFHRLAGMTGTGREAFDELWQIYHLAGITVPPHRPCIRQQPPASVFATREQKWQAIVERIEEVHGRGQPVLVGTRSVHASEMLAERLQARGLAFELLNAVRHHEEARIVAVAGEVGRITIATNMAGRGTDIKLGAGAAACGGLHVIITEVHDAGRIDRQLAGRAGRQGDPGSVSVFMSLEDEVLERHLPAGLLPLLSLLFARRLRAGPALIRQAFRLAQRRAERQSFQRRRSVLQADRWLESALPFE